jgi:dipeptidyl aminopeptidase/acylaminoacyl peptidase
MGCGGSSVGQKIGIYFTQNVSGRTGLYHMQTPQSKVEEVLSPKGTISGLSMNKENKLLFSKEDATHPQKCSLDLETKQIQQLTNSAPTAIETSRLSIAEPFKVKSFDNTPIEGFLYKPTGHAEKQLPAVLVVHGGPSVKMLIDLIA